MVALVSLVDALFPKLWFLHVKNWKLHFVMPGLIRRLEKN
jgi:hypothetical protein